MIDPVEFQDYIFDRYAFLNTVTKSSSTPLSSSSSEQEIKDALKTTRVKNHPDRLEKLDEKIKEAGEKQRDLIEQCSTVLLNPQLRAYFDEKLQEFKEKNPRLVSIDGRAIVDLSASRVDLSMLVRGDRLDLSEPEEKLAALSPAIKDTTLARRKQAYEADPADAESLAEYQDVLRKKLLNLTMREDFAWEKAGVHNLKERKSLASVSDPKAYRETVKEETQRIERQVIPEAVTLRAAAQIGGLTKPMLMLSGDSSSDKRDTKPLSLASEEARRWTIETAQEEFKSRTNMILALAGEKEKTIAALLGLSTTYALSPKPTDTGKTEIILFDSQGDGPAKASDFSIILDNTSYLVEINHTHKGKTVGELEHTALPHETYGINVEPELHPLPQAIYCYKKFKEPEKGISHER